MHIRHPASANLQSSCSLFFIIFLYFMVTDSLHLPTLIFWGWFICTKTQKTKKWPIKYYFYRYSDNPVIVNSFGQHNHVVKSDIVTARPASRRFLTSGKFHEDELGLNVHGSNKRASRPEPATGPSRGQWRLEAAAAAMYTSGSSGHTTNTKSVSDFSCSALIPNMNLIQTDSNTPKLRWWLTHTSNFI